MFCNLFSNWYTINSAINFDIYISVSYLYVLPWGIVDLHVLCIDVACRRLKALVRYPWDERVRMPTRIVFLALILPEQSIPQI